jgi:hypothetical protein
VLEQLLNASNHWQRLSVAIETVGLSRRVHSLQHAQQVKVKSVDDLSLTCNEVNVSLRI